MNLPAMSIETITAEIAKEYLAKNVMNRPTRRRRIDMYAAAMAAGEWAMTGEPIIFNSDGLLVNGQHRLLACVSADVSFQSLVIRNVSESAYDFIDSGLPRTAGDVVEHAGIKNGRNLAAAARLVIAYTEGVIHSNSLSALVATRTTIREEIEKYEDLYQEAGRLGHQANRNKGHIMSGFSAFYVIASKSMGQPVVEEFATPLATGANLDDGDPRLTLLNQILGPNRPRTNIESLALLIRAWNAWRHGETRRQLKGWGRNTPFPTLDACTPDAH